MPQPIPKASTITKIINHSGGIDKSSFMQLSLGGFSAYYLNFLKSVVHW